MRARVPTMKPRIPTMRHQTAPVAPKRADPVYQTPEHAAWSSAVIDKAGGRCEWVENGRRCTKARPEHRMVADHKIEVKDGGALLDPKNGQCLCVQHNTLKGVLARQRRMLAETSEPGQKGEGG